MAKYEGIDLAPGTRTSGKAREVVADKKSRGEGFRLFDQLVGEYPDDRMVYFKRAEARE
jgi:hypothetical protein